MKITHSSLTDTGLKRKENQDKIAVHVQDNHALFAVADGMGGHSDGQYASTEIIAKLDLWWHNYISDKLSADFTDCVASLCGCIDNIHEQILGYSKAKGIICGSTLSLVLIHNDFYAALNVGDSPILTLSGKIKAQLSVEHSYGNMLKKSGAGKQAAGNGHKLVQSVGAKERVYPNIRTGLVSAGQVFLICSDGVSNYIDNKHIFKLLKKVSVGKMPGDEAVSLLKGIAYKNGATDNLSVIIAKIERSGKNVKI